MIVLADHSARRGDTIFRMFKQQSDYVNYQRQSLAGLLVGRDQKGYYDQRPAERLIPQPRAELNFAAQDASENRIGAGLSDTELGLRLRYKFGGSSPSLSVCHRTES